jgi:hypothetical protein
MARTGRDGAASGRGNAKAMNSVDERASDVLKARHNL